MNNRLKGLLFYTIGALDRIPRNTPDWRGEITPWLAARGAKVISPIDKPVDLGLEDDDSRERRKLLKQEKNWDELTRIMKVIRRCDLRFIDLASCIIMYLPKGSPVFGTVDEYVTAVRQNKPCILLCEDGKEHIPDWAFAVSDHRLFFNSWSEVRGYLQRVDEDEDISEICGKQWLFLDKEFLCGER